MNSMQVQNASKSEPYLLQSTLPLHFNPSESDHEQGSIPMNSTISKLATMLNHPDQMPDLLQIFSTRWSQFYQSNGPLLDLIVNLFSKFEISKPMQQIIQIVANFMDLFVNFLSNSLGFRAVLQSPGLDSSMSSSPDSVKPKQFHLLDSDPFSLASIDPKWNELITIDRTKRFLLPAEYYRMKAHKFNTMIAFKKWKLEQFFKIKVWLLLLLGRIKQAILGKNIIRDEDINFLIRLFYPELYSMIH